MTTKPEHDDFRFSAPLYTAAEAARFLGVPASTLATWVRRPAGRAVTGIPIVTSLEAPRGFPTIPFIGLAEAMVIAAFREAGMGLQQIRKAVSALTSEFQVDHVLAAKRLCTDGAAILYDYAKGEDKRLSSLVSPHGGFSPVVEAYLNRIEYDSGPWAVRVASPVTRRPIVIVDPERSFGQPIFRSGAAPVEGVVGRVKAGESVAHVAEDFGVPIDDVTDYLRVALPVAA